MCTRFTIARMAVTASSNELEAAAQFCGLVPGGMPTGTELPVGDWHAADIGVELADVALAGPTDERRLSVLTLSVEAL